MSDSDNSDKLQPDDIKSVAGNFISSMKAWQSAGRPVVTKKIWNERLNICRNCEYWQEIAHTKIARCKRCGCSSAKLLLGTSKCPLNPPKWESVTS
jgi:hypothetical protein